jgi:hypothetical protein
MFRLNPELNALQTARMAEAVAKGLRRSRPISVCLRGASGRGSRRWRPAAILVELVDIPPGPRRDEAITAAMRFPRREWRRWSADSPAEELGWRG